jgi:hypothetical protein
MSGNCHLARLFGTGKRTFGLTGELVSALDPLRTFHRKGIIAPGSTKEHRFARPASI